MSQKHGGRASGKGTSGLAKGRADPGTGAAGSGGVSFMAGWIVKMGDRPVGPLPLEEIKRLFDSGAIDLGTEVRPPQIELWLPLGETALGRMVKMPSLGLGGAPWSKGSSTSPPGGPSVKTYLKYAFDDLFELKGRAS